MKLIQIDGSGWRSPDDFYAALLPELGAPNWHGRNLDALHDSLSGDINQLKPPFAVEITSVGHLSPDMAAFLAKVAAVFEDARHDFDADVSFKVS